MMKVITAAMAFATVLVSPILAHHHKPKDIVTTAVTANDFTTLVAAVAAADLVDVLQSDGPFTVFAPTDAAFAALPEGTLGTLLEEEDRATLTNILTYHVVPGKITAADLIGKVTTVNTAAGLPLTIDATHSVSIGNARLVTADVPASNGVIHIIDAVLLPPAADTH